MGLKYHNANHTQEAEYFDADGNGVVRFSSRVNGFDLPVYSSWLTGTEAQYQDNHVEIHQARIQFIQDQGKTERRLVSETVDKRDKNVVEEELVEETAK